MNIHNAGQHHEAARVDSSSGTAPFADAANQAIAGANGRVLEPVPDEDAATFNTHVHRKILHDRFQLSTTNSTRSGANRERDVNTGSPEGNTSTLSTRSSGRPGTVRSRWASSASAEVAEIRVECRR
jgi:hypothetical protein